MKRVYLTKMRQGEQVAYIGNADPRLLCPLIIHTDTDDAKYQRAISRTRVSEVAAYVLGDGESSPGILPGALILGTRYQDRLPVCRAYATTKDSTGLDQTIELYYIDLPETEEEIDSLQDTLDIMDGQHRLTAFSSPYVQLPEHVPYEVNFTLYVCPSLQERRMIFRTTNENQKPVNGNLLMWFREKLGLLNETEADFHPVVTMLNTHADSPLRGRIIMGDEVLPKGYKAQQIVKIFDKAKFAELEAGGAPLSQEALYQVIVTYLRGWETACEVSFAFPQKGETATKISAIRYMLFMLPTFWDVAIQASTKFNAALMAELLWYLTDTLQLEHTGEIFSPNSVWSYAFRGEGATVKLAEDHARMLKRELQTQRVKQFNPLEQ